VLPFCHLQIKALRSPYPRLWKCTQTASKAPKTLGEHVKKRRLELHLLQSQLARLLRVDRASVQNWERSIHEPNAEVIPNVIDFLGYDPR
jgi:DNA-binding transcriptional regulator YiaG